MVLFQLINRCRFSSSLLYYIQLCAYCYFDFFKPILIVCRITQYAHLDSSFCFCEHHQATEMHFFSVAAGNVFSGANTIASVLTAVSGVIEYFLVKILQCDKISGSGQSWAVSEKQGLTLSAKRIVYIFPLIKSHCTHCK